MIYDFLFKTGNSYQSLYSPMKEENIEVDSYDFLTLPSSNISGANASLLSVNGQTLVEQSAVLTNIGFGNTYLCSGDYYVKTGENFNNIYLTNGPTLNGSNNSIFFNLRNQSGEASIGEAQSASGISYGLNLSLQKNFPQRTGSYTGMNSFDYFLNGQKIYSGNHGDWFLSGASFEFLYTGQITGKIFAIPKNSGINAITGQFGDIYGERFLEGTVFGYANGVRFSRDLWLEMSTGVTTIETGVQSKLISSIFENSGISL